MQIVFVLVLYERTEEWQVPQWTKNNCHIISWKLIEKFICGIHDYILIDLSSMQHNRIN